jgi:hypothetical protein
MLHEIAQAAAEDADAAFPAERLAQQQRRILDRVDTEPRPARVIAFPAARTHDTSTSRIRPATRWIAAAAMAGLVVGVVAGRFGHDSSRGLLSAATITRPAEPERGFRAAADGRGGASLRPLDDLTPRAWDVTR